MKKSICFFLLSLILLQSGALLLLSQFQKLSVQYKMGILLEDDHAKFEKMVLSIEEYKMCKVDKREILVNGEMYDVKQATFSEGMVELLVIHDKHEGKILKRIGLLLSQKNKQESKSPSKIINLLGLFYIIPDSIYKFEPFDAHLPVLICQILKFFSFISELDSPPPEFS